MKKQYIAPAMQIENVEMECLLGANSITGNTLEADSQTESSIMQSKSTVFDLWSDDEE